MEYNHEKIKEYWNRYIAGFEKMPDHLEGLDDRILNSWKRSVGRINPYSAPTKLSKDELQKLIEDNVSDGEKMQIELTPTAGNEPFYEKAGFKYKPDKITGMYLWIKK